MRLAGALLALSTLALLAACSDNQPALPPAPEKKETLTRFEFGIGGVRYAISLPEQAAMRDHGQDGVIFYARKMQRQQRTMTILAVPRQSDQNLNQEHLMRGENGRVERSRPDRVVRYRHLGRSEGGSAGAVEDIAGRIQIGPHTLFLECSDQSEWSIRADWCLDYIDSIEVIAPPSSGNG